MDSISFQNGFVCGIATKGLVKSGAIYEPVAYNDAGVYDFFYLDFKRVMTPFSIGQFTESVIVSGTGILTVSQVTQATDSGGNKLAGVYKIYCDISAQTRGVFVVNNKNSRLCFSTGEQVPVFSTSMYVSGLSSSIDGGYAYDSANFISKRMNSTEHNTTFLCDVSEIIGPVESYTLSITPQITSDSAQVTLL